LAAAAASIAMTKEDQKAETRERLRMAALTLFATQGYDATPVSDIAAIAGVSERTFFLHFPTKADAVMGIAPDRLLDQFVDLVVGYKGNGSHIEVLEDCLIAWLERGDLKVFHHRAQLVLRAASLSVTVRGKESEAGDAMAAAAISALARRRGLTEPTLEMKVAVTTSMALIGAITADWATQRPGDLRSIAHAHFDAFQRAVRSNSKSGNP
jgi:AcrR family transcriptional regulator